MKSMMFAPFNAILATALMGVALFAVPPVASAEVIDFQEALQRAELHSPDYDIAKQGERSAVLATRNAWTNLLPMGDIEAQHFYTRGGTSLFSTATPSGTLLEPVSSTWSDNLGVTISENLYDNGDSIRQIKIAEDNRRIGELTRQKSFQQLYLNVAKAYYGYSLAAGSIDLQSQEIETLRKEFQTIEGRYRQGVNSSRDYLRIKAQLERAEIDFTNQKVSVEDSLQTLRTAIGDKTNVMFKPLQPSEPALDAMDFPDVHAEDSFDFRIAHLQNEISDLKYRTTARQEWPRVSLKGAYSYNDPEYIGPNIEGESPYWNFQVALVVDYSIWDWGTRRRNTEIADTQRHVERDQQESVRLTVVQDLNRLRSQITLLQKAYQESKQVLQDENNVYASLNRGYRDGTVTYLDLITALDELFSTRTQALTLQYNLLTVRAALAFYQGNLNDLLTSR